MQSPTILFMFRAYNLLLYFQITNKVPLFSVDFYYTNTYTSYNTLYGQEKKNGTERSESQYI
jgi:hypothetical protein